MALLYVDEHNASLNWGEVTSGETLHEGEFIVEQNDGTHARFDPSSDSLPHGIIVHHPGPTSDALVADDETYVTNYDDLWTYDAGENFYWQPLAAVDQIRPPTLSDNSTDPAPSFGQGDVVGIVTINTQTEVVEEGYVDNGNTTYNESNNNFLAIGRVDKYPQELRIGSAFSQRLPVRLDADIYTSSG